MTKITDLETRELVKRQMLENFADGLPMPMSKNPPVERVEFYRGIFDELAKKMSGEELKRFELYGQLCGIILPPCLKASA